MSVKEIISALLGFLTPMLVVGVIASIIFGCELIGAFNLPSDRYWSGFWVAIGLAITGITVLVSWP